MKKKFITFCLLSILGIISISAGNSADKLSEEISSAVKTGDAKLLAKYFSSTLDVTIPDVDGTYSKAQAEMLLKDFFLKNQPKSFTINHQGTSSDGSVFYIGSYQSVKKSFRIYFLLKKNGDKMLIQQIRFEEN